MEIFKAGIDDEGIKKNNHNNDKDSFLNKKSDFEIWRDFKSGSDSALTYIYRSHINELYNYGCQFTINKELVQDVIQELFIELLKKRKKLGDTDSIKYYLFKSLRRKLIRSLNKEKKYVPKNVNPVKGDFEIELSPELKIISEQDQKIRQKFLEDAFNQLPLKQKEAVLLYFYEGLSYDEIASIMKMTKTKSARALIYRAVDSLNQILKENKEKISFISILILIAVLFGI